ncbi:MAG: bifunctional diaminohydroxyphosphoribosylaminopyrimidine deaminase/5-amino-6-(5-phosphoribosylamino)uracil reductase RibD [Candidatus Aerophobetes bacterium]|nr:bifunctional diaminohydroxyphosphoribosylaminopyrimidine deaminase/5-amino-6-(5-phosphoribosylamino)uracil reductase RibD [Candidatus Aerophobetes bacterium]
MEKEKWMRLALKLAKKGEGKVSPNPLVGAVIAKNGKMIAQGYHHYFGGPHAEIDALRKTKDEAEGSALYVTLEPCSHYGKTPPCTKEIIKRGIKKVVIATLDPNPINSGKGVQELRRGKIETEIGICEEEAKKVNEAFLKFMKKRIPFITVKVASSLDGKIATPGGESKWITSEKSRKFSHRLRDKMDAILVGINTIIRDDPSLLAPSKNNLARIILDSRLRIPLKAEVLKNQDRGDTFIFTTSGADERKFKELKSRGIKIAIVKENENGVDIEEVVRELGKLEIMNLLIEGGGEVIGSFFEKKLVDKIYLFLAPRIIGGRKSITWVEGKGVKFLKETSYIKIDSLKKIENDLLLEGYVKETPVR